MKPYWNEVKYDIPASRDPTGACFDEAWQAGGGKGTGF